MDIHLKKKPWYIRYRYYLLTAAAIAALCVYSIVLALGPSRIRVDADKFTVSTAEDGKFMEYVDAEGIVQPILTVKVNALEGGFVDRILAEDGTMLHQGDTILLLKNPDLMRAIDDEQDEWLRQQRLNKEQQIEMAQKSITLRQQTLDAQYELGNLDNRLKIAREEYDMGMKSKAEIDIAENEYTYHKQKTLLQMQSLAHDSAASLLRQELLQADIQRAATKRKRAESRIGNLAVCAPVDGQLSYLSVTPGQQVQAGASIGEQKVLSDYKIHVNLNEYYIERVTAGLPANIVIGADRYPLRVSRVVPEVKDRNFAVDLTFAGERPSSVRVGKSFRVQIELCQPESATVLPRGDFYSATSGKWIYKLSPDGTYATKTPISIGRQNPRQYEILSGLRPGDKVIITGYERFADAERVEIK